jgi:hypothetical protein
LIAIAEHGHTVTRHNNRETFSHKSGTVADMASKSAQDHARAQEQQTRAFTAWINGNLQRADVTPVVEDLSTDLCDGVFLLHLADILADKPIKASREVRNCFQQSQRVSFSFPGAIFFCRCVAWRALHSVHPCSSFSRSQPQTHKRTSLVRKHDSTRNTECAASTIRLRRFRSCRTWA